MSSTLTSGNSADQYHQLCTVFLKFSTLTLGQSGGKGQVLFFSQYVMRLTFGRGGGIGNAL